MSEHTQSVGANPAGWAGKLAGLIMNRIHERPYKAIIKSYILCEIAAQDSMVILDAGCGGGVAVKLMSSMLPNAKVCGVDHSPEMVSLASSVCKHAIENGGAEISPGDIASTAYPDHYFDIITAFDTINFWPDFDQAMHEILRILKDTGTFIIVNGYPKEGTKWYDFVRFKNKDEYQAALIKHGFENVSIDVEKATIIIRAKPRRNGRLI